MIEMHVLEQADAVRARKKESAVRERQKVERHLLHGGAAR